MDIKSSIRATIPLHRAQTLAAACVAHESPHIRALSDQVFAEMDQILDFIDSFRRKDTTNIAENDEKLAAELSRALIIFFFHDGSPRSKLLAKAALAAIHVLEGRPDTR